MTRHLGVCYYPEHWPEAQWADDARRMAAVGLRYVRIGEFAWSRLEPEPDQLDFGWLERAIAVLDDHGLKIVLGTPTATPPKWLVDRMPDMLPVAADGSVRQFGSRRHYCFAHPGYRAECARIVRNLAQAFGNHPAVSAWQVDNEYDCHGTTLTFSPAARLGFRTWLARKYQSPQALNRAWGNVFWSMEYRSFDEIELPQGTVTEANPAHWMDFRRFASDNVIEFNRQQCRIIRRHSPGRDIIHNFMGRTLAFDHFSLAEDLDVASWDSYPLGFLAERAGRPEQERLAFLRAGDPDFQAFHHDLYRATGDGRWWVMEQQPGPVNWAPYNPDPRPGMVRLWSWEAFAHGAEVVSYFRWRQAPFAQEQMHSGLLRPDDGEAAGLPEVRQVAEEIAALDLASGSAAAEVAILFDYPSAWAWEIQPQSAGFDYFSLVFGFYKALRKLGFDVDFINASNVSDLDRYRLILVPGLFAWPPDLVEALQQSGATVLIGPRSGSKTADFSIPQNLPPGLDGLKVLRIDSLPETARIDLAEAAGSITRWREMVEMATPWQVILKTPDGWPLLCGAGGLHYLCGWPDADAADAILKHLAREGGLLTKDLAEGVRLRRCGPNTFAFNYGAETADLRHLFADNDCLLGSPILEPSGVGIFADQAAPG